MRKTFTLLFIFVFSVTLNAQNKNCQQPISSQQFQANYNQIKAISTDQKKIVLSQQFVSENCVSSAQVKEIAALFNNDHTRLQFAKKAYINTTDKGNFYDVYDAFIYYSSVFRLHDYIASNNNNTSSPTTISELKFPDYRYPSYNKYEGTKNCSNVVIKENFLKAAKDINESTSEQTKQTKLQNYIVDKCLTTSQIMKLSSLLKSENSRFAFAKKAFDYVSDIDNYIEMKQVFSTTRVKTQFAEFLNNNNGNIDNGNNSNICAVPSEKYTQIISAIKNESFNSSKVSKAKHLIETNKCFSAEQIKGIVGLFDYENSRIEIAIYSYMYTNNKKVYYSVVSKAFGFESSKKKLLNYINSQK